MKIKTITINKDTVVKTNDPVRLRVEAEKTMRAFEIGKSTGLFRSPKVLDYDSSKGILVLERLRNITNLAPILTRTRGDKVLIRNIASALAVIHDQMYIPASMHRPLPDELAFPGSDVVLHGDFSKNNVFVTTDRPGIAILDWQMTLKHGGDATYGTRYFDVMWFVSNIFGLMCQLNLAYRLAKHADPTARKFIDCYLQAANISENPEVIIAYMKQFFEFKLAQRKAQDKWRNKMLGIFVGPSIRKFVETPQLTQNFNGWSG